MSQTINGNENGKKVYYFTKIEKVEYSYEVRANTWNEAQELLENADDDYDFKDCDSHSWVDDGAFVRSHKEKLVSCRFEGMHWKSQGSWTHFHTCTTNMVQEGWIHENGLCSGCNNRANQNEGKDWVVSLHDPRKEVVEGDES
jgi:hypothetical protein